MTRSLLGVVSQWAGEKILLLWAMSWNIHPFVLVNLPAYIRTWKYIEKIVSWWSTGSLSSSCPFSQKVTHMGHIYIDFQPPSNENLVTHGWFLIAQDHQVRRVVMPCPFVPLHWRHNDHDGVSNPPPHGCLLNHLFRRRSKKTSKLRVTGLCVGNSLGTGEFPA